MNSYKKVILPNLLSVLMVPDKNANSVSFGIYVRSGSRFEEEDENGIAHFLEHMAFKGSPKYPTQLDVAKKIEGIGGLWNAYTSSECIAYYIKAYYKFLPLLVDVLDEAVFKPYLREHDIELEKGVILEEINMYRDDPSAYVQFLIDKITFKGNPLSRPTFGREELVKGFSRDNFLDFRKDLFVPSNIVVCVSGRFEEDSFLSMVKEHFDSLKNRKKRNFINYHNDQKSPRILVEKRKTEQTHFCISFKTFSNRDEKRFAAAVISALLGGGMGSRLFQEVRTKRGLAYYIYAHSESFMDTGSLTISAGVTNSRALESVRLVMEEVRKVRGGDISSEEIERAKELIIGKTALRLEDNLALNEFFAKQDLLSGEINTYNDLVEKIKRVSPKEIVDVASEIFIRENSNLAIVGPQNEGEKFLQILKDL